MLEEIWREFVRKYNLDTTWYYQEQSLAWAEYGILRAVVTDGYNDAEEAYRLLKAENVDIEYETIEKQLRFMSLEDKEQRLIFHEILTDALKRLEESEADLASYCAKIYDVFHAVAQTESEHKIKSFSDNFIYLPKGVLLAYLTKLTSENDLELYRKFILSKPKLAKACFNQFFGDYLPQI